MELQSQEISLTSVLTENYAVQSRRLSNNMFRVHKCLCSRKHHSRSQMLKHKRKCTRRRTLKNIQHRLEEQEGYGFGEDERNDVRGDVEEHSEQVMRSVIGAEQFKDIKNRVLALEMGREHPQQYAPFDSHRRAQVMLEKYQTTIFGIILSKVAVSLEGAVQANIKVSEAESSIASSIMAKLQTLTFDDCVQLLSERLMKAHRLLMEQSNNKSEKTRNYNERAYNFLAQFSQFELLTQVRVFDELLALDKTQRKSVHRYFSRLRRLDPYFGKYPELPRLFQTVPRGVLLSSTTIEQAARQIREIYTQGREELACDMWIVVSLGLRFHDLLRIYFMVDTNIPVKFVRLRERKNDNLCQRYIPRSLIEMVVASRVLYPATERRIRIAVRECLTRFKSSYGFKHRALTAILAALHKASPLARMHSRPQMTMNHYVNKNDERFIDQAFNIGISFIFDPQVAKKLRDRNVCLDLCGPQPKTTLIAHHELGEITIDSRDIAADRINSSLMDGILQPDALEQCISLHNGSLIETSVIAMNHQIELLPHSYRNIDEAISSLDKDSQIYDAVDCLVCKQGTDLDNELIIEKLAQVTQRQVHLYEFEGNSPFPTAHITSSDPTDPESAGIELVLSKNNNSYRVSTDAVTIDRPNHRLSALIAQSRLLKPGFHHRPFAPRCTKCQQQGRFAKLQSSNYGIECVKCGFKDEHVGDLHPFKSTIDIHCSNPEEVKGLRCAKLTKITNNLLTKTSDIYPGRVSISSQFSKDFPSKMTTTFKKASSAFQKEITRLLKNMEYLPLSIEESNIHGAGLGLVATEKIKTDTLVMVYTGVVCTSFSVMDKEENNSLFELGWVASHSNKQDIKFEVLVDGLLLIGPGRFINSSISRETANVQASTVVSSGMLNIYFSTIKDIAHKEELLYYYGNKYWVSSKEQPQQSSDSDSLSE